MMTPTESKALFQRCFKEVVAPVLKQDGFHGAGTTWRRLNGEVIHLFNIQGSRYGGECCINLAVHLTFLPTVGTNEAVQPKTITEPLCEFRKRLASESKADQWWNYGHSEEDALGACNSMLSLYQTQGRLFFERLSVCPHDFLRISPDQLSNESALRKLYGFSSTVRLALTLGRIASRFGRHELARCYAEFGLANVGQAVALRLPLEEILNKTIAP